MAITARFDADFGSFTDAVRKAEEDLKKLDATSKNTAGAMNEMVGAASKMAGIFGVGLSAAGLVEFGKAILTDAHNLELLSQQTQIGITDLQKLGAMTRDYGLDTEELGRLLFNLKRRIAGDDASVSSAYAAMGLSMDDVKTRSANMFGLFIETERRLGTLKGAMRDTAASDLFTARQGQQALAFASHVDEAIAAVDKLPLASEKSVQRTSAAQNRLSQGWENVKNVALDFVGNMLLDADRVDKAWADMYATMSGETFSKQFGITAEQMSSHAKGMADAATVAAQYMANIEANAQKPLVGRQREDLDRLRELGQLSATSASYLGVTAGQLAKYLADLEQVKASERALMDLRRERDVAERDAESARVKRYDGLIKEMTQLNELASSGYGSGEQIARLYSLDQAEKVILNTLSQVLTKEEDLDRARADFTQRHLARLQQIQAAEFAQAQRQNEAVTRGFTAKTSLNAMYGRDAQGNLTNETLGLTNESDNILVQIQAKNDALRAVSDAMAAGNATITEYNALLSESDLLNKQYTDALYAEAQAHDAASAATSRQSEAMRQLNSEQGAAGLTGNAPLSSTLNPGQIPPMLALPMLKMGAQGETVQSGSFAARTLNVYVSGAIASDMATFAGALKGYLTDSLRSSHLF